MNLDRLNFDRREALKLGGAGIASLILSGSRHARAEEVNGVLQYETYETVAEKIQKARAAGMSDATIAKVQEDGLNLELFTTAYEAGVLSEEDSKEEYDFYFHNISGVTGTSIVIDVCLLTIAKYKAFDTLQKKMAWVGMIGGLHVIFPVATGGFAVLIKWLAGTSEIVPRMVGGAGFCFVTNFLFKELSEDDESDDGFSSDIFNDLGSLFKFALPVSIDAAVSGPAKAEISKDWSAEKTLWSVFESGLWVMAITTLGIMCADYIRHLEKEHIQNLVDQEGEDFDVKALTENVEEIGERLITHLLSYFGMNALLNTTFKANLGVAATAAINTVFAELLIRVAEIKKDKSETPSVEV